MPWSLSVATLLEQDLVSLGAQVKLKRTTDSTVAPPGTTLTQDLQARVAIANNWPADIFVSIHCNVPSTPNPDAKVSEAHLYDPKNAKAMSLATSLHQDVVKDCNLPDGDVHQANFWVVKYTKMPSTLKETAYISMCDEEKYLADPKKQKGLADALSHGIQECFKVNP